MGASTWTNKLFNYQLFNYQLLNNYFTFITSTLCMFDKNVYKMTVVCCNYAAASHLWSVTTVLRFFGMYPAMGAALYRQGAMDNLAR